MGFVRKTEKQAEQKHREARGMGVVLYGMRIKW